jgi:hypothetical protein
MNAANGAGFCRADVIKDIAGQAGLGGELAGQVSDIDIAQPDMLAAALRF